jgi:serine/threonine-protein kinase
VAISSCEICGGKHPTGECSPEIVSTGAFARTAKVQRVSLPDLEPESTVGEYRVARKVGEGGMGIVYEGQHPLLGRKVAIKILNDLFARSNEASARFLQEARAASLVRHRNIVDVFAFGQLPDGRYYQVMEFLDGTSLAHVLGEHGVLGVEAVRVIIGGVLQALEVAHAKEIVHRDLKPDNIFVVGSLDDTDGLQVKILDFGLAKLMRDEGDQALVKSRTGTPMGTPAYMSPEQCRATGVIDHRSDLYSVGVILYELFSGAPPFDAESVLEVMNMHLGTASLPLVELIGMPLMLDEVIRKALAKKPEDRFQSAGEMHAALDLACFGASAFVPPKPKPRPRVDLELGVTAPATPNPPVRTPEVTPLEPPVSASGSSASASQAPLPTPTGAHGQIDRVPRSWLAPALFTLMLAGGAAALFVFVGSRPRPPPAPAPAPAPPQTASLKVQVNPPARIELDGKLLGIDATAVTAQVDPGAHRLHLEADGRAPSDREVNLHAGESLELSIQLTPAPGKAKVKPKR